MNESSRTGIYVVLAAAAVTVAVLAKPATIDRTRVDDAGQRFLEQFDPLAAKSMEIVSFSEGAARRQAFKVAQVGGLWSIPSHEGYPADAQEHLAKAASSVMDLKKGPTLSDSPKDHELMGVTDPTAPDASAGAGTRVTLQDDAGKTLVDLIIGKAVKDNPNLRFVRTPGKDRVYSVPVDTSALTTKFEDWIERDLLKLGGSQIRNVVIDNYSVDEQKGQVIPGDRLVLNHNPNDNAWTLAGMTDQESLKTAKLDEMRSALFDLKIVDVHRKPAGLSAQLHGDGNMSIDQAAIASLMSRGYYIGNQALLSNQGETTVRTSEGIEYILRFGEVTDVAAGADLGAAGSEADKPEEAGRYLFVTAQFAPEVIDQPLYDPVPELPIPASQPATQPGEAPASQPAIDPALEQARAAAIAGNEQKKIEFEKKVADAKEKVKSLNSRFADWYYVVSDSVYLKLKLKREDFVGPATAATAAPPGGAPAPIAPMSPVPMPTPMPGPGAPPG